MHQRIPFSVSILLLVGYLDVHSAHKSLAPTYIVVSVSLTCSWFIYAVSVLQRYRTVAVRDLDSSGYRLLKLPVVRFSCNAL